jgi:hypothetical protein
VSKGLFRVTWYRSRATLKQRWGGYISLILLIGLVGGLAMGAVAAARRTQSSFPTFLASTNPPDLEGITAFVNPTPGPDGLGYDPAVTAAIARLPHVQEVVNQSGLNIVPLGRNGAPENPPGLPAQAGESQGVDNNSPLDRPVMARGRTPIGRSEFAVTASTAQIFGLHLGEVVPFGVYTNAQTALSAFGTARVPPHRRFRARLVGIAINSSAVVEDQVDVSSNANAIFFPPAVTKPLLTCCAYYSATAIKVAERFVSSTQHEILRVLPPMSSPFAANPSAGIEAKAERAIKPDSIALGAFGGIAALAALLIAAQVLSRQLRRGTNELETLRALGADPGMTMGDGLVGLMAAVVIGALLAVGVSIGLSPLAPIGPVASAYPTPGVAFDWAVLGFGFLILVLVLSALAVIMAYRTTPHRAEIRARQSATHPPAVADAVVRSGLPPTAVTGIRFALDPGAGGSGAPVRSAIFGAALALMVGVATVTFGASLNSLVSHPALYGWNWDYELSAQQGGVLPGQHTARLLATDGQVAAWSGVFFFTLRVGRQPAVPVLAENPGAAVAPPILSGHGVDSNGQIVLGTITLAQLHKRVGDAVVVNTGFGGAKRLRIVGTATLPTIGAGGNQHLEMGTGALVSSKILPPTADEGYSLPGAAPGPDAVLVRLRDTTSPAGLRSLQRIARATSTPADYGDVVLPVQRPAEIVNFRSMGTTPAILGAALAAGAVVALGLTLVASVRRRQRDLALLKSFGFTRGQLASTVAWQASVAVLIGGIAGVPLGIVLGRSLWDLFAGEISVVPVPSVPAGSVALIALGALVLGVVIAAVPGRIAARTPTAVLLRSE